MGGPDQPYLSVVVASRNDGYAGGMLRRLQVCIDTFLDQAERFAIPSELILVDWNPPPRRDLWGALAWPSALRHCTIRVITVPRRVHARLPFATELPIIIHRARNVGIRRARGEFVLPTSADILLSNELAEWFSRRLLDHGGVYRIARHDVPEKTLRFKTSERRLAYCRERVLQVHRRDRSYRIDGLPELFTNGAGDFTLMSREMYFRLHGIPEEREYHSMHFDSVFCFMAHAAGAQEIELQDPLRIYHVDHGTPSWRPSASWLERAAARLPLRAKAAKRAIKLARRLAPQQSAMARRGVPFLDLSGAAGRTQYEHLIRRIVGEPGAFRYNDANWGLAEYSFEERVLAPAPSILEPV
jgi:hypothetical protein